MSQWTVDVESKSVKSKEAALSVSLYVTLATVARHAARKLVAWTLRQLNQDIVENLFSIIRSKGGARDNPDAAQFRSALRQVN